MIRVDKDLAVNHEFLNDNFKKSMQNEEFKKFISLFKASHNILKKYTSFLEESCVEYNNCQGCKGIFECSNKMKGYCYLPKIVNESVKFEYKVCKYKKDNEKNFKHLKNICFYNTPDNLKSAEIANIDKTIKNRFDVINWLYKFYKEYNKSSKGLYLHGSFGAGKTYLVTAIINELAKKNIKSTIIFWPEFLRNLKSSFDTDYEQKVTNAKNIDILLIDDLGAESVTSWGRDEILASILQHRMDNNKTTFITSNLNMKELESHLASSKDGIDRVKARRIIERVKFLTEDIELISKNLRNN